MIEKVARAIHGATQPNGMRWDDIGDSMSAACQKPMARMQARAAVLALADNVTDEMVEAAQNASDAPLTLDDEPMRRAIIAALRSI